MKLGMEYLELRRLMDSLCEEMKSDLSEAQNIENVVQAVGYSVGRAYMAVAVAIEMNNRQLEEQLKELGVFPRE